MDFVLRPGFKSLLCHLPCDFILSLFCHRQVEIILTSPWLLHGLRNTVYIRNLARGLACRRHSVTMNSPFLSFQNKLSAAQSHSCQHLSIVNLVKFQECSCQSPFPCSRGLHGLLWMAYTRKELAPGSRARELRSKTEIKSVHRGSLGGSVG